MKVITNHPVKFSADPLNPKNEYWLMIDGRNDIQVRHFQAWANKEHNAGLKVNGRWNNATKNEYAKYGSTWEQVFKAAFPDYQPTSPTGERRTGQLWDSAKGVWVTARDSGLLQQGLDALGIKFDTGSIPAPTTAPVYQAPPAPEAPEVVDEKKNKGWLPTILITAAVIVGGYYVYTKVVKGKKKGSKGKK